MKKEYTKATLEELMIKVEDVILQSNPNPNSGDSDGDLNLPVEW